ncbi:MAG: hypothetical protein B7X06_01670, partial [Verrucomicrobia bacterium 21-51-4]
MKLGFNQIAVLGPGLMGGSILKALHAKAPETQLLAYCNNALEFEALGKCPWLVPTNSLEQAVIGSDRVVITTPADAAGTLLESIAPYLLPDALVTDVCSVKSLICEQGNATLKGQFI